MTNSYLEPIAKRTEKSKLLHDRASKVLPGGVSYAVRYWTPYPFFISRAEGSRVWDVDGNEYVDFWMGHLAIIMGHGYRPVLEAAREQLEAGTHYGYCNEWEVKHAEVVAELSPCVEMFRPTNSGTEANMYAVRLARAYTKRKKVGKMLGGWHGGYEGLHKAVALPFDKPSSLGIPPEVSNNIIVMPYNDLESVRKIIKQEREELACITVEPMLGAGGLIPADPEFLKGLRELCTENDIVLIFDEVITGFRLARGGAQEVYGVIPDLAVFGKILGGGIFPAGGFGGRADIMELLDVSKGKPFYEMSFHGGTYAGNPLTARAGYVLLSELKKGYVYERINPLGEKTRRELDEIFQRYGVDAHVTGMGSVFAIHFTKEKPRDAETANRTRDLELTKRYFYHMLHNGMLFLKPERPVFAISYAHSEEELEKQVALTEEFIKGIKSRG